MSPAPPRPGAITMQDQTTMPTAKHISLNLMLTVATFFLGACGPSEEEVARPDAPKQWQWQQCVDENGNVVPDEMCENAQTAQGAGTYHAGGYHPYHWWYIYGGRPLFPGQNIHSRPEGTYSNTPFNGVASSRMAGFTNSHPAHPSYGHTTRGVFGSSASGRSAIG